MRRLTVFTENIIVFRTYLGMYWLRESACTKNFSRRGKYEEKLSIVAAGLTLALLMSPAAAFAADGTDTPAPSTTPAAPAVPAETTDEVKTRDVVLNLNNGSAEDNVWED